MPDQLIFNVLNIKPGNLSGPAAVFIKDQALTK
jgi:hypothetical protein